MNQLRKLEVRINELRKATMFEKSVQAQSVIDETLSVLKHTHERQNVLEARMDSALFRINQLSEVAANETA